MLTNWNNKVLYTGITNNLVRRLDEHKNKVNKSFTTKYNVYKLVYVESFEDVKAAIGYEKRIKGWTRAKKNALVESVNPLWEELNISEE